MKKNIILSIIVSFFIFISIYELISYIKYVGKIDKKSISNKVIEKTEPYLDKRYINLNEHNLFVDCLKKDILGDCSNIKLNDKIEINSTNKEKSINYRVFYDLSKSNIVILLIYILLIYTLARQIYLFLLTKNKIELNEVDFHNAEWNINTAPMFGLLGTFFSIAILLNTPNIENISEILLTNFFDAVMTTIIGIIFYIINFQLKIYIYPAIKFNEK